MTTHQAETVYENHRKTQSTHGVTTNLDLRDATPTSPATPSIGLRDYFAARAMQGELASCVEGTLALSISDERLEGLVKHWYRIADAMLKVRERSK